MYKPSKFSVNFLKINSLYAYYSVFNRHYTPFCLLTFQIFTPVKVNCNNPQVLF